jgi:hypothetical protein
MNSTPGHVLKKPLFCFRLLCLIAVVASVVSPGLSGQLTVRSDDFVSQNDLAFAIKPGSLENSLFGLQNRSSTFQDSCNNVRVNGDTLTAQCERENGRFRTSSIRIRGIHNNDGRLEYLKNSRGESTFQDSCRNARVEGDRLTARCQRTDGSYERSAIRIRGINNDNGRLVYFND